MEVGEMERVARMGEKGNVYTFVVGNLVKATTCKI
jgi:hypothetical protein